jgi:ribosomal protein S18 acetylase RimI-like enzyme
MEGTMHEVREFTPARERRDFEQLLPAFLRIWNAPQNHRILSFSLRPFDADLVTTWFEQHLSAGVRYFGVLDATDAVVGISAVRADPIGTFELFAMAVSPEAQGQGIGQTLVSHALDLARSQGFRCVEAAVFTDNTRMLRLLLASEFRPVRIDYHRRADGMDLVVLHRILSESGSGPV